MIFSTSLFLLYFLPVFLLLYQLTPSKYRNYTALIASLLFYMWGAPLFILILITSIVADFYFTSQLHKIKRRKLFIVSSLILNIGLLAYFKYANFFVDNLNLILEEVGVSAVRWSKVALPIGISFFTFQKISYSIDVYRGRSAPLKSIGDYALYIMLFPQLIAGPIVRYNEIADELIDRKANENFNNMLIGFYRFTIGLSKKVLIANSIGLYADAVFSSSPDTYAFFTSWLGLAAYTIQIYFDFSGYSDMAIGLGKMMGFNFPENFNNPFLSKSITEFWTRWHITLSNWMRDYIYIPLGGNKSRPLKVYINLWIVFLVSGLWHGANWNFILWGAFHGLFLTLDKLFLKKFLDRLGGVASIITFLIVLLSFVLFRSDSVEKAILLYKSMFTIESLSGTLEMSTKTTVFLVIGLFFSFLTFNKKGLKVEKFFFHTTSYSRKQHIILLFTAIIFYVICIGYINSQDFNPFIYFRF